MAIESKFYMKEPEKMECTLVVTMPLSDWISLKEGIDDAYPGAQLKEQIRELVTAAEQFFETAEGA